LEGQLALGFQDLIEILFIRAFRGYGVSLQTIRRVAREAARRWHTTHPFCVRRFRTDGRSVFATIELPAGEKGLIDLANSQFAFERVLNPYLRQIDYDLSGAAQRWWPLGKRVPVFVDPRYSFGRPVVTRANVPTEAIYRAVLADQSPREVARWLEIPVSSVRAAIAFEKSLAA
jgi:uncharacterized protein (DUF433 family)